MVVVVLVWQLSLSLLLLLLLLLATVKSSHGRLGHTHFPKEVAPRSLHRIAPQPPRRPGVAVVALVVVALGVADAVDRERAGVDALVPRDGCGCGSRSRCCRCCCRGHDRRVSCCDRGEVQATEWRVLLGVPAGQTRHHRARGSVCVGWTQPTTTTHPTFTHTQRASVNRDNQGGGGGGRKQQNEQHRKHTTTCKCTCVTPSSSSRRASERGATSRKDGHVACCWAANVGMMDLRRRR